MITVYIINNYCIECFKVLILKKFFFIKIKFAIKKLFKNAFIMVLIEFCNHQVEKIYSFFLINSTFEVLKILIYTEKLKYETILKGKTN